MTRHNAVRLIDTIMIESDTLSHSQQLELAILRAVIRTIPEPVWRLYTDKATGRLVS